MLHDFSEVLRLMAKKKIQERADVEVLMIK